MVTLLQNVRLESRIGPVESGQYYCEAWALADGIPPADDFSIVLDYDDPRELSYTATTVAWLEVGHVPDHFRLGIDKGKICRPWGWAAIMAGCRDQ